MSQRILGSFRAGQTGGSIHHIHTTLPVVGVLFLRSCVRTIVLLGNGEDDGAHD